MYSNIVRTGNGSANSHFRHSLFARNFRLSEHVVVLVLDFNALSDFIAAHQEHIRDAGTAHCGVGHELKR